MAVVPRPAAPPDMEAFYKMASYPLVAHSDMCDETRAEAMEICTTACEKYFETDVEKCVQVIKDIMDKKYGAPWHVVVGRAFSYGLTYECKNILYMYYAGTVGVLIWKT